MDSALLGLVGVSAAVMTAAVLYQQATKPKYTKHESAGKSKSKRKTASKHNSIPVKSNFEETEEGVLGSNPNPVFFGHTG